MSFTKCPLCDNDDIQSEAAPYINHNCYDVTCSSCGRFVILRQAATQLKSYEKRFVLSGVTRETSIRATVESETNGDVIERLLRITDFDFDGLIRSAPTGVADKANRLLTNVAMLTAAPGQSLWIKFDDLPLAYAQDAEELDFFVSYLVEAGYLEKTSSASDGNEVTLTFSGWHQIDEIDLTPFNESGGQS